MTSSDESVESICIGCGLCCDGTVVTHLAVSDESDLGLPLHALGVQVIFAAEPPVFELPCPALCDGVCTIHSLHRPSACAQFECTLSRSFLNGGVSREDAELVISRAMNLRHEVATGKLDQRVFKEFVASNFNAK